MQKQLYNEYIENSFYLVKKFPMCRILILAEETRTKKIVFYDPIKI